MRRLLPLLLLLAACGGDSNPITPPPPPDNLALGTPSDQAVSGQNQVGAPGSTLANPLRVLVMAGSVPFEGKEVTWTVSSGSVLSTTKSNAQGVATMTWKLGTVAGRFTAEATIGREIMVYYANVR